MKAVVLAGGQEFGQCPLSRQLPRAMWPLIDRPIIEHVLHALHEAGIGDMTVSANGHTGEIASSIGSEPSPGITVHYSEDALPRGAAGCIKDCQRWLGSGTFVVAHGASLMLNVDLEHLLVEHRRSGAVLTIAAASDVPSESALKPVGVYVCESDILAHIRERGYQDMKEQLIPRLAQHGLRIHAVPLRGRIIPICSEECYLNAMIEYMENHWSPESASGQSPGSHPTLWVDPGAHVHSHSRLVGPVHIGSGARVMAGAAIIGPAVIGSDCIVDRDAMVHESILWPGTRVGRNAVVAQTITARGVAIAESDEVRCAIVVDGDVSHDPCHRLSCQQRPADARTGTLTRWWQSIRQGLRPLSRGTI
jgi:NDP-sugar pyrophosphorylase family protein